MAALFSLGGEGCGAVVEATLEVVETFAEFELAFEVVAAITGVGLVVFFVEADEEASRVCGLFVLGDAATRGGANGWPEVVEVAATAVSDGYCDCRSEGNTTLVVAVLGVAEAEVELADVGVVVESVGVTIPK